MNNYFKTISICLIFFQTSFYLSVNAAVLSDSCVVLEINQFISSNLDDVEEYADGTLSMISTDIELVDDPDNGRQTIGLRFTNLAFVQGAKVVEAFLQFTSDEEVSNSFTSLNISTEASDNSLPFEEIEFNLSSRTLSSTSVEWIVDSWTEPWERSDTHRTPNLKELVQETIDRDGWKEGNSMSFIISGIGNRSAIAYDFDSTRSAELVIKVAYPQSDSVLQNIYINELMLSNTTIEDEHLETDDWFEIYNGNEETVFIGGLYLTDNPEDLQKWQITNGTLIEPNGFEMIWADGQPEQGGLHTSFKLKSSGEFLAIVQELNGTLYVLDSLTVPEVPTNISFGRIEDGESDFVYFGNSTPNSSNNGQPQHYTEQVVFSQVGGHFSSPVLLEMSVMDSSATIYYSLDGTTPTNQSQLYQNPILIDQTANVKAIAYKSGFVSANITADFYLLNEPSEIAVLNVQSDPDNFWNDHTGIYVSGTNGGLDYCNEELNNWNQDWERPCQLTLLEPDGTIGFDVKAGMKIGGACSKNLKMKSLNFFLRSKVYGDEKIDYQIFSTQELSEYRRIKIRNSGTDWQEMLFRDGMNQTILSNTVDLDLMAYRPVRVYLNGKYWGIYGIREMFNSRYIESHHGVDKDSVDLLGDPYGPRSEVREGEALRYQELMDFIDDNSLTTLSNYEAIREFIDVQEYINYYISQIYFGNYDWPGNNVRVWRDQNGGKFRWMLFDTDASTGWIGWGANVASPDHNTLAHTLNTDEVNMWVPGFTEWPNGAESTYLFRKMIESDAFKNEFVQRTCTFRELIFAPERVLPMVDSLESLLLPEMQRHISQWLGNNEFGEGIPSGGSVFTWQLRVDNYRKFFSNRANSILSIYASTLGLDQRFNLSFGYNESTLGKLVLHENEMSIPFNYVGEYFKNMPIKIKAVPNEGQYFSHWLETGDTNAVINFVGFEDQTLTPIFSGTPTVHTQNEMLKYLVNIYPSPTQNLLNIDLLNHVDKIRLVLYNVSGKVMLDTELFEDQTNLEMSEMPNGIYLVKLDTDQGSITKRIIKN